MVDRGTVLALQIDEQRMHWLAPHFGSDLQGQMQKHRAVLAAGKRDANLLEVLKDQPQPGLGGLMDIGIAVVFLHYVLLSRTYRHTISGRLGRHP